MKTLLIAIVGIALFGAGVYLYSNSQDGLRQLKQKNYSVAKSSEIVGLKNGDSYNLTAGIVKKNINGIDVKMLAYNGSIPGPLIKVSQGAEITLNFKNDTDVDSTIHSHGVRAENKFDGVPDVTQKPVKPGESFTYKLKFPDIGIYWYHPHIREDYAQELGLYGNFLVTPTQKDYWAEVDREEALFLDDILMQKSQIATFSKSTVDHALMGRFGNVMLVNGDDNYKLNIKQGERVRFYVTNAANTRVFNFSIPNTRMKLVGGDNGKLEKEEWVDSVVISPSERVVVEVWFDKNGEYQIAHATPDKTYVMGAIGVEERPTSVSYFLVARTNQDLIDSLNVLRPLFEKSPDKTLNLTLDMMGGMMSGQEGGHMMPNSSMMGGNMMMGDSNEKIEWEDDMVMMNAMSTNKTLKWKLVDDATQKVNMDIDWQFKKGDKIKIKIFNDPKSEHPMQHPIHIHGQRFLVVNTNGAQNQNLVWKDTALIQTGDTVEFLVQMDNPGTWVIHCHIPEHMEAGMMSSFKVV
ncbi:MAG: multicopper oxidase family protein [Patescibacteria group bacterium]